MLLHMTDRRTTKRPGDTLLGYGIALLLLGAVLGVLDGGVTVFTGGAVLAGIVLVAVGRSKREPR